MNKSEYLKQMTDEQLADALLNSEEEMLIASCKPQYCPFYEEDGGCSARVKGAGMEEGCKKALLKWLSSEVKTGGKWYE